MATIATSSVKATRLTEAKDYSSTENLAPLYDVLIIGGGTAGLVLASRISEEPSINVLVLEAGRSHIGDPLVAIPGMAARQQGNPEYDYEFKSVPQPHLNNRSVTQHRGKGLGGTSQINLNSMVFPSASTYDSWEALGNPGWGFDSMLPYLRKFHTFHDLPPDVVEDLGLDYYDPSLHGKDGPIQVTFGPYRTEFCKAWSKTWEGLGYKATKDPITGHCQGAYHNAGTIDPATSERSFAGVAYLNDEVVQRPNLRIVTEAQVQKILFEDDDSTDDAPLTARGASFIDKADSTISVSAREVILSAGVVHSPAILELSGIGQPALLRSLGIPLRLAHPSVGENLQDHVIVGVSLESAIPTFDRFRHDGDAAAAAMAEYRERGTGPMAFSTYSGAFMPCLGLLDDGSKDRLGELLEESMARAPPHARKQLAVVRRIIEDPELSSIQYLQAPVQLTEAQNPSPLPPGARDASYVTLYAMLSHPFSRGSVHITTAGPSTITTAGTDGRPSMDPRYFSDPLDVEIVARHLSWLGHVARADPLRALLVPGGRSIPADLDFGDLAQMRALTRCGFTSYHPCGTCAMMPQAADGAGAGGVVAADLRVHGVGRLRVVDASVFPIIPRGNIVSSVYAVAERAADMVKSEMVGQKAGKPET